MHYLHAVLVSVEEEEGAEEAKAKAIGAIEPYAEIAFDWHAEGPGRWSDVVPDVLLGSKCPDQFLAEFEKRRKVPLESALEHVQWASGRGWAWRTQEEIDAGGYRVFPNDLNGQRSQDGKPVYWSAKPERENWTLRELVEKLWEPDPDLWPYHVARAVTLADGEYRCDSHFYSVPDRSTKVWPETLQEVREHPERFALVFLDLHN